MTGHQRGWSGHWDCHCAGNVTYACSTGAPFLAVGNEQHVVRCWIRCGCYTVPYASGGQGAMLLLWFQLLVGKVDKVELVLSKSHIYKEIGSKW